LGETRIRRRFWSGLAPKLGGATFLAVLLIAGVMTYQASNQLASNMHIAFEVRGEAIALALAATAEQTVGTSSSNVQGAVDSNKVIAGVSYIYIEDAEKAVVAHTFSPSFPEGMLAVNPVEVGEDLGGRRVKVDGNVDLMLGDKRVHAIDVAAPVAGGALGVVHIGMDKDEIDTSVRELRVSMVKYGAVAGLFGIVLALLLVIASVVRPVRELTRVTSEIVGRGDLTQEIAITSNDEIGQLAESFTQMVEKLREIPHSLMDSVDLLGISVANLSKSAQEQSNSVSREASALQETQVTAQEIKQTSLLASQKAEAVLRFAERADEISRTGEAAIELSSAGLAEIRSQVADIAQKISQLGERTRQIGGITETVKDLADQSNILALNAAIEAVRSGEHGKSFAIVAREIRSLADQSIQATARVREILEDISSAVRAAVSISERGAQKMETGLTQIRSSGDSLRALSGIVRDNSGAVRQIAAAVNQQNAGITQIFTAVTDLSKLMEETVKQLESTNRESDVLKDVSERLSKVVRSYRV